MLRHIPARTLVEWTIYEQLEPFGDERADLRTAAVLQLLANIHRDRKKHSRPWPLADFVLRIGDAAPPPPVRPDRASAQRSFDALKMMLLAHAAGRRPTRPRAAAPPRDARPPSARRGA